MTRHPGSFAAGLLAGALLMYYLDARSGARRRALVRDKLIAAGQDAADLAQAKGRRAIDQARGVLVTRRLDRVSRRQPESDEQLHDRIRSRLGRMVSHPRAVHVEVEQGHVRLSGHVLAREVEPLLRELRRMAGVHSVQDGFQVHDTAEGSPELQGRTQPPGREQRDSGQALH